MQIEMTIKGLMVDPITNMPIIVLRDADGQRVLPIWVGIFEANAIALQMENIATPRPMTHDLLRNVIEDLNGIVRKIVVSRPEGEHVLRADLRRGGGPDHRDRRAAQRRDRAGTPGGGPDLRRGDGARQREGHRLRTDKADSERLQKWLESLDPEELGKYKM